ncbi:MAG: hypothetical protein ACYDH6_24575 [Acidimicrobiales bacterium]
MRVPVIDPPKEVSDAAEALDGAIERLMAFHSQWTPRGYESYDQAWTLGHLVIRFSEAVAKLACTDLGLLAPAAACARSAFEAAVRSAWLLAPARASGRESRWAAIAEESAKFGDDMALDIAGLGGDASVLRAGSEALRQYVNEVRQKLPPGTERVRRVPTVKSMLVELARPESYSSYRILSQYVHGTGHGGAAYRHERGVDKATGAVISASDWAYPLAVTWNAVVMWGMSYSERTEAGDRFPDKALIARVQATLSDIAPSRKATE